MFTKQVERRARAKHNRAAVRRPDGIDFVSGCRREPTGNVAVRFQQPEIASARLGASERQAVSIWREMEVEVFAGLAHRAQPLASQVKPSELASCASLAIEQGLA